MADRKKTAWDNIPSVNLDINDGISEIVKPKVERKHPRTDLESLNKVLDKNLPYLPVKMATPAGGEFKGMILDVSENGCRIAVSVQLKTGEVTKVGFIVNKRTIISRAIVRWISPQKEVYLMGMEFQDMPIDAKEFLRAISAVARLDTLEIDKIKQALK